MIMPLYDITIEIFARIQGTLATIQSKIFCLPVSYQKT
jgi:hypothetical protein